jgi:putative FmdB family regulatory protein
VPIYEYRCDECGATYEVFQKISDDPLETCERCDGRLRKVLYPAAIHFKGSGFYTTDYGRSSTARVASKEPEAATGSDSGSRETSSDTSSTSDGSPSSSGEGKKKEKQPAG